jgi:hypothetical protein
MLWTRSRRHQQDPVNELITMPIVRNASQRFPSQRPTVRQPWFGSGAVIAITVMSPRPLALNLFGPTDTRSCQRLWLLERPSTGPSGPDRTGRRSQPAAPDRGPEV